MLFCIFGKSFIKTFKMNTSILTNKINMLPDDLQRQVADFVEFLIIKYQNRADKKDELTSEQKDELLELWDKYEKNPDDAISVEMLREQTVAKYGL
jgi:septum formation topological specificity factor MinE